MITVHLPGLDLLYRRPVVRTASRGYGHLPPGQQPLHTVSNLLRRQTVQAYLQNDPTRIAVIQGLLGNAAVGTGARTARRRDLSNWVALTYCTALADQQPLTVYHVRRHKTCKFWLLEIKPLIGIVKRRRLNAQGPHSASVPAAGVAQMLIQHGH